MAMLDPNCDNLWATPEAPEALVAIVRDFVTVAREKLSLGGVYDDFGIGRVVLLNKDTGAIFRLTDVGFHYKKDDPDSINSITGGLFTEGYYCDEEKLIQGVEFQTPRIVEEVDQESIYYLREISPDNMMQLVALLRESTVVPESHYFEVQRMYEQQHQVDNIA